MRNLSVVYAIGDLLDKQCMGCPTRTELMKKHGSAFSHIDGYCNKECPVGKQLQTLGSQLGRGAESETDNLCCRGESKTSCGTSELSSLLAPKCHAATEVSCMA